MRHMWPYTSGVFCFTPARSSLLSDQSRHQVGKLQKICHANERAALADDDLRIRRDGVRPLAWHRAHPLGIDPQQEPRAVPVVPLADANELSSAERVERMGYAYKTRCCVRRACILC